MKERMNEQMNERAERKKDRKAELSCLNLLLCLLVIFIHASSEPVSKLLRDSWQYFAVMVPWRLAAFVVQGFFFLSGVKLCLEAEKPFHPLPFYRRRFQSVVVPYLIAVALYYCWFVHIGYFHFSLVDLARYVVVGNLVSPFYFVVTIVQFYLLAPLFRAGAKRLSVGVLLAGSFAVMIICRFYLLQNFAYADRVFTTYLFYFVSGCAAGAHYQDFCNFLHRWTLPLCVLWAVLAAADICSFHGLVSQLKGAAEWIHTFYCIAAIPACAALCLRIARHGLPRLIVTMDAVTYPVFLCHSFFIFWLNDKLTLLGITDLALRYGLRLAFVYPVSFSLCIGAQRLRQHFLPQRQRL